MPNLRIKPQFEMDRESFEKFRTACGEVPVRWVVEEMLKLAMDEESLSGRTAFKLALFRATESLREGRHRHGRPVASRNGYKRFKKMPNLGTGH